MRIIHVCAASLLALSAAACGGEVGDEPAHLDCEGGYLWVGLDWNGEEEIEPPLVCAELGDAEGLGDYDPTDSDDVVEPPPPPEVVARHCLGDQTPPPPIPDPEPEPDPLPEDPPTGPGDAETTVALKTGPLPAPACPADQWQTRFKKFRGPLLVGGRNFGEHSATRISLWKATWNVGRGAYDVNLFDTHDHGNHGPSPADMNMRKYAELRTDWTFGGGVGETTFGVVKDKWCPCNGHINHQTSNDSCYGFRAPNHVCHSDTLYQQRLFSQHSGSGNPPANVCGQGLFGPGRFAP